MMSSGFVLSSIKPSNTSMEKIKLFLKTHAIGRILLIPFRFTMALSYHTDTLKNIIRWTWRSREIDNLTYDIDELNTTYLAAFVAVLTRQPITVIQGYLKELNDDIQLRNHIRRLTEQHPQRYIADLDIHYGRRAGWYAFVRALKPKVVVETGTNKGLGSCVIAAALWRNTTEGHPGHLYTTDIDSAAGYLLRAPYDQYGEVLYGDSITSLRTLPLKVDLFINDSDHSQDYETREYETIAGKLSTAALMLGDNAHCSPQLYLFAQRTGRQFLFFQEKPKNHWHPGAGIGAAYRF